MKAVFTSIFLLLFMAGCAPTAYHSDRDAYNFYKIRALLEPGKDLNIVDRYDHTPLIWAIENSEPDIIKLLLSEGANPNAKGIGGSRKSPLHYAAEKNNKNLAKLLLAKGAYLNYTDIFGHTPLDVAVDNNNPELAKYLLIKNAEYNGPKVFWWTAYYGHAEIARMLLKWGVNPNVTEVDDIEYHPLRAAVTRQNLDVILLMIKYGVNPDKKDRDGKTSFCTVR